MPEGPLGVRRPLAEAQPAVSFQFVGPDYPTNSEDLLDDVAQTLNMGIDDRPIGKIRGGIKELDFRIMNRRPGATITIVFLDGTEFNTMKTLADYFDAKENIGTETLRGY